MISGSVSTVSTILLLVQTDVGPSNWGIVSTVCVLMGEPHVISVSCEDKQLWEVGICVSLSFDIITSLLLKLSIHVSSL